MKQKTRRLLFSSAFLLATASHAHGGASAGAVIGTTTTQTTTETETPPFILDAFRVSGYGAFDMDFDKSQGGLDVYQVELQSFLSKPISFGNGFTFLPTFRYEGTFLRYDGTLPGFPLKDEDLHSLELPLYLIHTTPSSPWIYGAYLRPALATDFQHIDSDDIFVDAAVGVGYKFSNSFYLGGGLAIEDAFGNEELYPGVAFLWSPREDLTFQLLGPVFTAEWKATPDWKFSVDVRAAGGAWNIDDNHQSRTIDFTSYRAGLQVQRRLMDTWWVEAGGGITFANEMDLKTHSGLGLNEAVLGDLDEGVYGYLAVRKEVWWDTAPCSAFVRTRRLRVRSAIKDRSALLPTRPRLTSGADLSEPCRRVRENAGSAVGVRHQGPFRVVTNAPTVTKPPPSPSPPASASAVATAPG